MSRSRAERRGDAASLIFWTAQVVIGVYFVASYTADDSVGAAALCAAVTTLCVSATYQSFCLVVDGER